MAIRYSGDVEIRLTFDPRRRVYIVRLRAPGFRAKGDVRLGLLTREHATRSESYDKAALKALREAQGVAKRRGFLLPTSGQGYRTQIRRTFQSPCPL